MKTLKDGYFYATNLAFSKGVYIIKSLNGKNVYQACTLFGRWTSRFYLEPKHVHTSWESAMQEVERMRTAKISSLEKQIQKVKSKTFTEPE